MFVSNGGGIYEKVEANGPGPFGFLWTGGLALATMTGGRATEGIVSEEWGGERLSRGRNEMKQAYIQNWKRREVKHFEEIILFSEFVGEGLDTSQ